LQYIQAFYDTVDHPKRFSPLSPAVCHLSKAFPLATTLALREMTQPSDPSAI
jgi:hypothetical protein